MTTRNIGHVDLWLHFKYACEKIQLIIWNAAQYGIIKANILTIVYNAAVAYVFWYLTFVFFLYHS